MAKKGQARRAEIIRLVSTTGVATVDELAAHLKVTSSTIRRDLAKLTDQGQLARTYGGVMSLENREESSPVSLGDNAAAKRGIAAWAAAEVRPGETIAVDAGSTVAAFCEAVAGSGIQGVTTVSASLPLVELLLRGGNLHVVTLGGAVVPPYQVTVGPFTDAALARFTFDRVFLGARGLDPDRGLNEPDFRLAGLKEALMGKARHVYVLAESRKLTHAPYHMWPSMPALWTLVTDDGADHDLLERYRDAGIDVVVTSPLDAAQPEGLIATAPGARLGA